MAALEPYRFEPEHVLKVADDDSRDDNEINERWRAHSGVLAKNVKLCKLQKNVFVVLFTAVKREKYEKYFKDKGIIFTVESLIIYQYPVGLLKLFELY